MGLETLILVIIILVVAFGIGTYIRLRTIIGIVDKKSAPSWFKLAKNSYFGLIMIIIGLCLILYNLYIPVLPGLWFAGLFSFAIGILIIASSRKMQI
jgi:hypothetical protein